MKDLQPFLNPPGLEYAASSRNLPRWFAIAGLIAILPTLIIVAEWTMKSVLRQLHQNAADELKVSLAYMQSQIDNLYMLTRIAGADERAAKLTVNPKDRLLGEQINQILARFAATTGTMVYILDRQGQVLASGNPMESNHSMGQLHGLRPYLEAALNGKVSWYVAMGLAPGRLGYYLAIPIRVRGRISGVVVTKTDPQKLILPQDRPLRPFLVTDQNGVVIIASRQAYLFHSLVDLPPSTLSHIQHQAPYAGRKISALGDRPLETISTIPVITLETERAPHLGAKPRPHSQRFVVASAPVANTSWTAHQLLPVHELDARVVQRSLIAMLALLAGMMVLLFAIERWRRLKQINAQAIRDPLTGLYTRLYMLPSAGALLSAHDRQNIAGVSAILFDLDHFKAINDRYGHSAGDNTLVRVAAVLLNECRDSDIPVRYGGEEFLLFVPTGEKGQAVQMAERIRNQISTLDLTLAGQSQRLTISGGVVSHRAGETLERLIDRADQMLYQAKESGRNRICW